MGCTLSIEPQKVAPEEIEEEEKVGNGNQPPLADGSILAKVGKPAPHFNLESVMPMSNFQHIDLNDYKGRYVVLFFYPLDFTFVCPTEIIAFSDAQKEFTEIECDILACSVDSVFTHFAWRSVPRKKGGLGSLNIPMLSDITKKTAREYGVLLEDDGVALRGLFIIDRNGIMRQSTINDLPVGRDVQEVKRLVTAFQFTDEHGEVCPAGWRPGDDTMKPDVEKSLDYFEKKNTKKKKKIITEEEKKEE